MEKQLASIYLFSTGFFQAQENKHLSSRAVWRTILPRCFSGKESLCSEGDMGSTLGSGISPGERMQPMPVFLLGKPHGQRMLAGYSLWSHRKVWHDLAIKQQHVKIFWASAGHWRDHQFRHGAFTVCQMYEALWKQHHPLEIIGWLYEIWARKSLSPVV